MKVSVKLSLALGLSALLAACAQEPVTVVKAVPALRPSSIYNLDSVDWYLRHHGNFYEAMAASYLAKAKEAEPQNMQQAIYFVKRAITVQPNRSHYQYLIELLGKAEQEEEMEVVYRLLLYPKHETRGQQSHYPLDMPEEEFLYDYLVFSLNKEYNYTAGEAIWHARTLGFSMSKLKERLLQDERFTIPVDSDRYKNLMLYFMSDEEIKAYENSPENFNNFLASAKESGAHFTIDEQQAASFQYRPDEWDEYDFTTFFTAFLVERKENPESWYEFQTKHRLRLSDQVQAMVYAVDSSAHGCPVEMRHIYHRLVTYDPRGNIIASQVVATQAGEALLLMEFRENVLTISDYARTWKNPYEKENFDNYVVRKELVGERQFRISEDGRIESLEQQPLAAEL